MLGVALSIALLGAPEQASAQSNISLTQDPLVVRNDRGGRLLTRIRQLTELREQSRPVEIRGNICYSTCTMFLSLPTTCISPDTTFGFHGPSSWGRALDPATFNRASEIIAAHYPEELQGWYMETGRYRIRSVYRIRGEEIIDMGVRAC
ncbi:MAG: hypothetical protein AAFP13_03780 [Pseudomonadota bacterium]